MKQLTYFSSLLFLLLCNYVFGTNDSTLKNIEIFSLNPKIIETYAAVSFQRLMLAFEPQEGPESKDSDYHYTLLSNKNKIKKFTRLIQQLSPCYSTELNSVNARIVVKLNYTDEHSEFIVLENINSQHIYFKTGYVQKSPEFYKKVLKQLPLRFRFGVKIRKKKIDCH